MSIDPQLLNKDRVQGQKDESESGQEIRRGKVRGRGPTSKKDKAEEENAEEEKKSKRRILKKNRGKNNNKKEKEESSLSYPVHKSTKMALRWSWVTLLVTGGFSMAFSLAYLNFHLLFRNIMPSFFCKMGEEWSLREEANKARSTAASKMNKKALGFFEILGVIFLDFIMIVFIGLVVVIVVAIAGWVYKYFGWLVDFFI